MLELVPNDEQPCTRDEALALVSRIKTAVAAAWMALEEAYRRKAHIALGYATWDAFVRDEFNLSRSRSYQLLDHARVVRELSAAVGVSNALDIDLSARDVATIKANMAEARAAVVEAVASVAEADTFDAMKDALVGVADTARTVRAREPKVRRVDQVAVMKAIVNRDAPPTVDRWVMEDLLEHARRDVRDQLGFISQADGGLEVLIGLKDDLERATRRTRRHETERNGMLTRYQEAQLEVEESLVGIKDGDE